MTPQSHRHANRLKEKGTRYQNHPTREQMFEGLLKKQHPEQEI